MSAIEEKVRGRLFAMQDKQYQAFQQKLLPSLPPPVPAAGEGGPPPSGPPSRRVWRGRYPPRSRPS